MAMTYTPNGTPAGGAAAIWALVQRLMAAGWTKPADSDGNTYSSSGAAVSGAAGLSTGLSWVRLRSPAGAGGREFIFQLHNGGNQTSWRIKYSASAGFTGGSPSATQVPSATDEFVVCGGGSDGSPSFYGLFAANGTYRWQVGADNAAPYGFYGIAYPSGGGSPTTIVALDPMLTGSAPAADVDQAVLHVAGPGDSPCLYQGLFSESAGPLGWLRKGLEGEGPVRISALILQSSGGPVVPAALGTNPHSDDDEGFPVCFGRRAALTAPVGGKGVSSLMKWLGSDRSTGDTVGTKARIVVGHVTLPWDGSTTPQV